MSKFKVGDWVAYPDFPDVPYEVVSVVYPDLPDASHKAVPFDYGDQRMRLVLVDGENRKVAKFWEYEDFLDLYDPSASTPPVADDTVNHPAHYTHFSGFEAIDVVEQMPNPLRAMAIKYQLRAGHKDDTVQDLEKAIWYLQREVAKIKEHGEGWYMK